MIITLASIGSCAYSPQKASPSNLVESTPPVSAEPVDQSLLPSPPEVSDSPEVSPPAVQTGPDLELRDMVEDSFFEDAAIMGNSLIDGFRAFSGITTADYYAATSMTVVGATSNYCITLDSGASGTVVDGITQKPYAKIYILLGINEIGMNVSAFSDQYAGMLDIIIEAQPDCDIYIMGLTPVSYNKSSTSDVFNMTRIGEYNDALYKLAEEKGCFYLNLVDALTDDTGYLPAEETSDGVHFSAAVYKKWADYLRTHYV